MSAPAFDLIPLIEELPSRQRMVTQSLDFATRDWVPEDENERIDPLRRLFDPTFTETTWFHDHSRVGDLPGKLHPKQLEALNHPARHRWLFWGNQCTVAGTRVLTARGILRCEDVRVGDVVLGPKGLRQTVESVYVSPVPVPLFRLRTRRGFEVTGNAEHPLFVADSKTPGWEGTRMVDERTGSFRPLASITPNQFVRLGMRSVGTSGAGDWPETSALTGDDGYFLGLMTGDGWWRHGTTGRMSFVSPPEDESLIEWLERYLGSYGVRTMREARVGSDLIHLRWCNIRFKRRVESWGVVLGGSADKAIPEAVWTGTEAVARGFLRGLFDTDGCASPKPAAILVTVSRELAEGARILMARWGLAASVHCQEAPSSNFANAKPRYRVVVNGQGAARFKERIGFGLARKQAKLPDPTTRHTGSYRYDRIVSVEPAGDGIVYGFTCPPGHVFYGNGLLNHNTGKTTLGAIDVALGSLGRHPLQLAGKMHMPPLTSWASAITWELWEKIMLPELLSWLPHWRVIDAPPPFKQSTKRDIIVLADNGRESRITGKAAEQGAERYQSARVDLVWLDEEHPEPVWDEMQPRLLRFGGRTLATMTPMRGMTWVHGRVYEPVFTGRIPPDRHWFSHAGIRDNPSITPEARAEMLEELKHNPSQLAARDEGRFTRPFGSVLPWDPEKHLTAEEMDVEHPTMVLGRVRGAWYGSLDLGKWRFAFAFGFANREGEFLLVDEYFNQGGDAATRAKGIHAMLTTWRVPDSIMIPADCADPKGIKELNEEFERIESPYRVYAIDGALKSRTTGVARVENLMNRGAFRVRRGMAADSVWYVGRNASNFGKPVQGSRWMWEAANWQYPKTPDGKVQKDDPDDASADGADMMDVTRYLIVSFFPADGPVPAKKNPTLAERIQKELEDLDKKEEQEEEDRDGGDRYGGVLRQ